LLWGFVFVVIVITIFHSQLGALADFLINPKVSVPDNIPLPGGK
jgi:hypothetical protein